MGKMIDPKTSIGGIVALSAVGLLIAHRIDTQNAIVLLGIAGGWIGIKAADSK